MQKAKGNRQEARGKKSKRQQKSPLAIERRTILFFLPPLLLCSSAPLLLFPPAPLTPVSYLEINMSRRRSTPWIHRWSRPIITTIGTIGAIETAYLTIIKLSGDAACPTEGCDQVLNSPYAEILGIPLTIFGFLAYVTMAIMAAAPLAINPEQNKSLRLRVEQWTWLGLFAGATAMTIFSSYLMYLLAFKIKALCIYCIASALFSLSFLIFTLMGHAWEDLGQLFFTGTLVGMVTLIGVLGVYNITTTPNQVAGNSGPPIISTSGSAEMALAEHLRNIGAKKYGAYWCPHCHDQKELFGKEAFALIDYVECDPNGQNPRPQLCNPTNIKGYPTWEINGQFYAGTQSLERLSQLSGYQGPRNFQNTISGPQQP